MLALSVFTLCLGATSLLGQTDPNLEQGIKPYATLNGGNIDSVNTTNGHLTIRAPFYSLPQRGGKLKLSFSILYDNNGFIMQPTCAPPPGHSCIYNIRWKGSGVQLIYDQSFGVISNWINSGQHDPSGNTVNIPVFSVKAPDGYSHQLLLTTAGNYESIDATGFRFDFTNQDYNAPEGTLTDANGVRYPRPIGTSGVLAEDPNGNYISYSSTSGYTDTLVLRIVSKGHMALSPETLLWPFLEGSHVSPISVTRH